MNNPEGIPQRTYSVFLDTKNLDLLRLEDYATLYSSSRPSEVIDFYLAHLNKNPKDTLGIMVQLPGTDAVEVTLRSDGQLNRYRVITADGTVYANESPKDEDYISYIVFTTRVNPQTGKFINREVHIESSHLRTVLEYYEQHPQASGIMRYDVRQPYQRVSQISRELQKELGCHLCGQARSPVPPLSEVPYTTTGHAPVIAQDQERLSAPAVPPLGLSEFQAVWIYHHLRKSLRYTLDKLAGQQGLKVDNPDGLVEAMMLTFLGDASNPISQLCVGDGPRTSEQVLIGHQVFPAGSLVSDVLKRARADFVWQQTKSTQLG